MTEVRDVRWHQRLDNYLKALTQLTDAVTLAQRQVLRLIEQQGLVKAFEFTYELAWNLLKDYFEYQGIVGIIGSRDSFREAFQKGIVSQGDAWMEMIKSRNQTPHIYNETVAKELVEKVVKNYHPQFLALAGKMQDLKNAGR